jgi:molecular chaperone GrpE (heat shock protein)
VEATVYSPQKAADIAGVSRTAIMSAIKSGKLLSKKNNRGHHRIAPEELNRWIEGRGGRRQTESASATDTQTATEIAVLREQLKASLKDADNLREQLEREWEQLERERAEKTELFDLLKEAQRRRGLLEILTGKRWSD